ncbi:pol-related protein [Clonorchis sinensis]|uniref:Pol-related protein n=1 Tax=Clonorchis sinensis TaxID=79923 RepID=G7YY01_CLOSI|nr:pol-related protein [Clonorchis sinensis]
MRLPGCVAQVLLSEDPEQYISMENTETILYTLKHVEACTRVRYIALRDLRKQTVIKRPNSVVRSGYAIGIVGKLLASDTFCQIVVYSGRTKDVILIERVQRAATKMVDGLKSLDYETHLVVLDLFPLEYRRLRGDLILTYALFEQG